MGMDKEAVDIWKFGRPRPDLAPEESFNAPEPDLSPKERHQREQLIESHIYNKQGELIKKMPMFRKLVGFTDV